MGSTRAALKMLADVAAADVEVDRQGPRPAPRPRADPSASRRGRGARTLRFAGEKDAAMPGRGAALELAHVGVDVPERHRHDGDQPSRVGRRPVTQEVVVGLDADELERVIVDLQEFLAAEAGDVRIEHLRPDAVAIHQLQPGVRVVRGGVHVLVGRRSAGERFGPAGECRDPGRVDLHPVQEPDVDTGVVAHHMRNVVDVAGRHPSGPHVPRLGDVGVAVDDVVAHGRLRFSLRCHSVIPAPGRRRDVEGLNTRT